MNDANQKIPLLLSGPGRMGRKHAELVSKRDDLRISVVVAPATEENLTFACDIGAAHCKNIDEALVKFNCAAAIICSPSGFHFEQTMSCIDNGIPVLVEKPLTNDIATARKLTEHAEASDVEILVGHHRHHNPLLHAARAYLNSSDFGDLICVQGSALFYKPDDYFTSSPWRTGPNCGPTLINLIHEVGVLRFLCGEIRSVLARTIPSRRGHDMEDSAAVLFEFENGAIGTFLLSDCAASNKSWEMTTGENSSFPNYPGQNCYHLAGSLGSLDFPSMRHRSYAGQIQPSWISPFTSGQITVETQDPLWRQLDHFVDVIRKKCSSLVPIHEGYKNMDVLDAIFKSAATRSEVRLT